MQRKNTTKFGGLGWKPSLPRFGVTKFEPVTMAALPEVVDMEGKFPGVYDQGQLGSCTANAISGLCQFLMMKESHEVYMPSRLAIYYWERELDGTTNQDAGASIADSVEVVSKTGTPFETDWTYDVAKFAVKPNQTVAEHAAPHKVSHYSQVHQDLYHMQNCLAAGNPIVLGFTVYESFESDTVASTGIVPMPQAHEQILGGHAVVCVGYNSQTKMFKVRNSWGASWGLQGYFWMPFAYLTNNSLSSDFWTATVIA